MLTMTNETSIANIAFAGLQRRTGLLTRVSETADTDTSSHVTIQADDGGEFKFRYEIKATVDRRDHLLSFKAKFPDTLLVTQGLSSAMAEQCRELEIPFIDYSGNCYVRKPGLFVFIWGAKDASNTKRTSFRGLTPAALRVVFAVLIRPVILQGTVRSIAEAAAISHGSAGSALQMLEEIGFFISKKNGGRILTMPERWLDAWTEGYLGRIRPKLEKYRMSSQFPLAKAFDMFGSTMGEVALGGEAAADYLGMGLKPGSLTLYIDLTDPAVLAGLANELKLRRDPEGHIELISMFWNTKEFPGHPTVPSPLIYADLVGTGDSRTMEIAANLKQEICNYVASEA